MKKTTGFSLVELLVSVLIFAIGLVGLAGLQIAGIRSNQMAYHRSIATQLAYDMAERMRSNPVGFASAKDTYKTTTAGTDSTKCESSACTQAELVAYDLKRWYDELAQKLPNGKGIVCLDSTPNSPDMGNSSKLPDSAACDGLGRVYAVKVWWDDNRSGDTAQGFVTSVQLEGN